MNHPVLTLLVAAKLCLLAGCATSGSYTTQDTTKYSVENTEKFVLLDSTTQQSVSCTGLLERLLPDGRIEVVANVKNRENRPLQLQIQCLFKDKDSFSTLEQTPWQTLLIAETSTEAVTFTARNSLARKYTILVRQPR